MASPDDVPQELLKAPPPLKRKSTSNFSVTNLFVTSKLIPKNKEGSSIFPADSETPCFSVPAPFYRYLRTIIVRASQIMVQCPQVCFW